MVWLGIPEFQVHVLFESALSQLLLHTFQNILSQVENIEGRVGGTSPTACMFLFTIGKKLIV